MGNSYVLSSTENKRLLEVGILADFHSVRKGHNNYSDAVMYGSIIIILQIKLYKMPKSHSYDVVNF